MEKIRLGKRTFLVGGAAIGVAATAGMAVGSLHDGELGAPAASYRGAVPWEEGAADSPPAVTLMPVLLVRWQTS
ncbi:MAG: hypothetical protein ABSF50_04905 [Burkholderiaceae bacterium]|jgi:hypothetical protein